MKFPASAERQRSHLRRWVNLAFIAAVSLTYSAAIASSVTPGTVITSNYVMPGGLHRRILGVYPVPTTIAGVTNPCSMLFEDGSVAFCGARLVDNRFDASSLAPDGPFVQIASGAFGLALRADGSVVGWPAGTNGTVAPAGSYVDISVRGTGAAGVRTDGKLRIWGTFAASMPFGDPGPYADVEVSPSTVVARRTDGTLVEFGTAVGAPTPPAGGFVQHKVAGTGTSVRGIARRADGTVTVWGAAGVPGSFANRMYSSCIAGDTHFGGIDAADGALWIAVGTAERRFEGPFSDAVIGTAGFVGLQADGKVVRQLAVGASGSANILVGQVGPRLPLWAYPKAVAVVAAGSAVSSYFLHGEDGSVRLLDGVALPGMSVQSDGAVLRDIAELYPIVYSSSSGGGLVARTRSGQLVAFAASASRPYNMPEGNYRRFVGEAVVAGVRHLFAINAADELVRWDPAQSLPAVTLVLSGCGEAAGQSYGDSSASPNVLARDSSGSWTCIGAGDSTLCTPPSLNLRRLAMLGTTSSIVASDLAFALDAGGALVYWGSDVVTAPPPSGVSLRAYGVTNQGLGVVGAAIAESGAFVPWGFLSSYTFTLNDPAFAANDIVQTMSQCTVRVGASDCDGDGILDWDEIVAAGAGGDCNDNGLPDSCDIAAGAPDANGNGVLDSCEPPPAGDLNGDHAINAQDLAILLSAWGSPKPGAADLNGDGVVNAVDMAALLSAWTG